MDRGGRHLDCCLRCQLCRCDVALATDEPAFNLQSALCLAKLQGCLWVPGAGNDYQKDIQFRKLNASKDTILVKVVRGAQASQAHMHVASESPCHLPALSLASMWCSLILQCAKQETLIPNTEVLVGDVLMLDTGDKVVADGLVIHGHGLVIDEASLTGESEPQRKGSEDPWCRSGT